tara:strand:- start:7 stop:183 length:177 start_codon:yes stop_codon:yes gene_type:complete
MKFNFNEKQIELIQDVLFNQKLIWLEDEKEYRSDIKLIEECRNIIDNELKTNKSIKQS